MNRRGIGRGVVSSIAHEVNQPLSGITTRASAALRWLAANPPDVEKARATLTQIVDAGHRAGEIVASVRAMFKKDANEHVPVDINQLIVMVLAILRIDLEKNHVEVRTRLDEQLPVATGDNVQLQQVVLNLVMNAIESMQSVQPRVLTVQRKQPGIIHVSIEDTGTGLLDPRSTGFSRRCSRPRRVGWEWAFPLPLDHREPQWSDLGVVRRRQRRGVPI
jgi:C4-dicarboxylate-specific signal transduction histidine kinase